MFNQILTWYNASRLADFLGLPPGFAVGPYVFDRKTDAILAKLGRDAREHLERVPCDRREKVVFFLGYHHSKFIALNDATIILALQLRGVEVIPVTSGLFYQKEDVIYGGWYNDNRFKKQYNYSYMENTLVSSLLNADPVSLVAFVSQQAEVAAKDLADSATFSTWKGLEYSGLAVGEMAGKLVCNMNNMPAVTDTPEYMEQLRWHIYNIVRLADASNTLLKTINPSSVVSNAPFYYRWHIPFKIARSLGIPFYSYAIGERENTLAWACNTEKIYDCSPCWNSFKQSDVYKNNKKVVEHGIENRVHGRISHIRYLSGKNKNDKRIAKLVEAINGRPVVLFPTNVLVDAAVLLPTQAFGSCFEMITAVVDYFSKHPEYFCILKAHPAEKVWKSSGIDVSSMHLRNVLASSGVTLPENVFFIDYDEEMSSFNLYEMVNGLIAYSSSTCMEISWFGKRIISSDDSHYCCAGFAYVPKSSEDFFRALEDILNSEQGSVPDPEIQKLGRIYYLLYYYVILVDLKLFEGNDTGTIPAKLLYNSIDSLLPGKNAALDHICDSIVNQKPIFGENRWPPVTA